MSNNTATSERLVPKSVHTKMWELDCPERKAMGMCGSGGHVVKTAIIH